MEIKLDPNETLTQIQIKELPKKQLKDYFRAITLGYRRAALNILLGVGVHYKKAEGILPEFGPARNTPHSIFEDILADETIPIISNNALMRTKFEVGLQQVRLGTNGAWTEMFDKRDDKTLALKYLERKINGEQLKDAVSKMNEPVFKFE